MKENYTVKSVTGSKKLWSISTQESSGFGLDKKYGIKPKKGDIITLYTTNGTFIRGMDLNGKKIYYKSDAQLQTEHLQWRAEYVRKKQEDFEKNEEDLNRRYNNLPKSFQERIDRFRKNNPNFRVDYESYEMFCCEQALEIAKACKTKEKIQEFSKMDWKKQKNLVKKLDDGHSGNTFNTSVTLAYHYLNDEEDVKKIHGALSTLVGSEEYGDIEKK